MTETAEIRAFIVENFLFGDSESLEDDTSFLDKGIVDSTGMMELVAFLDRTYGIQIQAEELVPENLDSLRRIGRFLDRKLNPTEQHPES